MKPTDMVTSVDQEKTEKPQRSSAAGAAQMVRKPDQRVTTKTGRRVRLGELNAYYGSQHAVKGMSIEFAPNEVTAIIGPSGCGKSTMVRCINRMHEEVPGARATGTVQLDDVDVYADGVDVVSVRRTVGMVFQKPNPFPTMSVDRKSTRLNSSHPSISYAVFCLKKKKN